MKIKKEGGPKDGGGQAGNDVPAESLNMMTMMGFPEKKCIKALKKCDMNVERATDWLFSHMDDPDSEEGGGDADSEMQGPVTDYSCDKPGRYGL